jgi:hypothetical protein
VYNAPDGQRLTDGSREGLAMAIQSGEKILLTGAGFTHNFGTPLADGMWAEIFNHRKVQGAPKVRELMMRTSHRFDFERVYQTVMNASDFGEDDRQAINDAVEDAYSKLDSIVMSSRLWPDVPIQPNVYTIEHLIEQFGMQPGKSFFFSLNQDLFVERHYHSAPTPHLPGIEQKKDWFSSGFKQRRLNPSDDCLVPEQPIPQELRDDLLEGHRFFYLKLHGSQNWRTAKGLRQMVIGRGKEEKIRSEPLLDWYLDVFHDVLCQPNRRLLVIGYSFGDDHINKIIHDAVISKGLRLYILSPQHIAAFRQSLIEKQSPDLNDAYWNGLAGYFPYKLSDILRGGEIPTPDYTSLQDHFFGVS